MKVTLHFSLPNDTFLFTFLFGPINLSIHFHLRDVLCPIFFVDIGVSVCLICDIIYWAPLQKRLQYQVISKALLLRYLQGYGHRLWGYTTRNNVFCVLFKHIWRVLQIDI